MQSIRELADSPKALWDLHAYFNFNESAGFSFDRKLLLSGNFDLGLLNYLDRSIRKFILELEDPNSYAVHINHIDRQFQYLDFAERIFTLCPYTASWLNRRFNTEKFQKIYFPVNPKYVRFESSRPIDVIYAGRIVHELIVPNFISPITDFKYCWVCDDPHPLVTHKSIPYSDKMRLHALSKIAVVHNLLFWNQQYVKNATLIEGWNNNLALKWLKETNPGLSPQFKSRTIEAAMSGCVILCLKDRWNVIEEWFDPSSEFIYYESISELKHLLNLISSNYESYKWIGENAQQKALSLYSTNAFVALIESL